MSQTQDRSRSIRLSNRQYGQLKALARANGHTIGIEQLASYNQVALAGIKRRGLIIETKHRDGVVLTKEGQEALDQFSHADFFRQVASMNFSSYLRLEPVESPPSKRRRRSGIE